jgi:hypothetical protein
VSALGRIHVAIDILPGHTTSPTPVNPATPSLQGNDRRYSHLWGVQRTARICIFFSFFVAVCSVRSWGFTLGAGGVAGS